MQPLIRHQSAAKAWRYLEPCTIRSTLYALHLECMHWSIFKETNPAQASTRSVQQVSASMGLPEGRLLA